MRDDGSNGRKKPAGVQVPCRRPKCGGQVALMKRGGSLLMGDCIKCGRTYGLVR